jgi:hypothetical protein
MLAGRHTFEDCALYQSVVLGQCLRLLCCTYVERGADVSNSYAIQPSRAGWSKAMFDIVLFLGFVLLCAYIAYERMSHHI